jgi:hypothetical protein
MNCELEARATKPELSQIAHFYNDERSGCLGRNISGLAPALGLGLCTLCRGILSHLQVYTQNEKSIQ